MSGECMQMERLLVSMPESLALRMRAAIPARQRSKTIARLLEEEIARREQSLYECALAVEKDEGLRAEMQDWSATVADGLDDESW